MRREGLRLCTMGYFGECEDKLDLAERYAPAGTDKAVQEAREDIKAYKLHAPVESNLQVKGPLGPGEHPLRP